MREIDGETHGERPVGSAGHRRAGHRRDPTPGVTPDQEEQTAVGGVNTFTRNNMAPPGKGVTLGSELNSRPG